MERLLDPVLSFSGNDPIGHQLVARDLKEGTATILRRDGAIDTRNLSELSVSTLA